MAYVDVGEGDPIVFLHGNPTSSYLWRNVIPHVQHLGRCIAPDLIGMGESDKLPDPSRAPTPSPPTPRYLADLLDGSGSGEPGHPGAARLGLGRWASTGRKRHRDRVRGIAFTEAIVTPLTWDDWPADGPEDLPGHALRRRRGRWCWTSNVFVERILPASVAARADPGGARPLPGARSRRRTTAGRPWSGRGRSPSRTCRRTCTRSSTATGDWLAARDVPKLFVDADPGSILVGRQRELVRRWPNLTEVTVPGSHFVPEDSPHEIGRALAEWIPTLR